MQGFYLFVKFGLVLIYILKVYRKKSSSILLRKNMFNSLLAFCFWKACTFSSFERFLCWKSRNYSQIYLPRMVNYWCGILTLYITWGALSFGVFFFFLSCFFLFLSVLDRHQRFIRWDSRGNNYFSCFPLPPANKHSFDSSRFLPLIFNRSICNYQTDSWWNLCSLNICILFAFLWMQLSRSHWLWHFKVTLWVFEFISNYHPSITKRTP